MSIKEFISSQPAERQGLLTSIHEIIMATDKTVKAAIKPMMGKEMIIYDAPEMFKYGLASVKNYMSLHIMPIYASPTLYSKYQGLLDKASFQKGCINFKHAEEMPLEIVKQLFEDCSKVDLKAIKESFTKSKPKKG